MVSPAFVALEGLAIDEPNTALPVV